MEVGRYEYRFHFTVPKNLPSTYNGEHGHIRYSFLAKVNIPLAFDYKDEKRAIMMPLINFNDIINQLQLVSDSNFYLHIVFFTGIYRNSKACISSRRIRVFLVLVTSVSADLLAYNSFPNPNVKALTTAL